MYTGALTGTEKRVLFSLFTAHCENVAESALVFISFSVQDLAFVCSRYYIFTLASSSLEPLGQFQTWHKVFLCEGLYTN